MKKKKKIYVCFPEIKRIKYWIKYNAVVVPVSKKVFTVHGYLVNIF